MAKQQYYSQPWLFLETNAGGQKVSQLHLFIENKLYSITIHLEMCEYQPQYFGRLAGGQLDGFLFTQSDSNLKQLRYGQNSNILDNYDISGRLAGISQLAHSFINYLPRWQRSECRWPAVGEIENKARLSPAKLSQGLG